MQGFKPQAIRRQLRGLALACVIAPFVLLSAWAVISRGSMAEYLSVAAVITIVCAGAAWVIAGRAVDRIASPLLDRAELRLRADELSRSNQELERFAYVASHDLQEPLRMIASYLQLLQRRYKDKLDKDAEDFIGFAIDGAVRMKEQINALLEYSRVGRQDPCLKRVSLDAVLSRAVTNLDVLIQESGAVIERNPLPEVEADPREIERFFQNILANAIKFRKTEAPRVRVSSEQRGAALTVSFADNGIGIDPAHHEKIFQIFQRLNPRELYEGVGLGLTICRKIAERHGGTVSVRSAPGEGSTFVLVLPAARKVRAA